MAVVREATPADLPAVSEFLARGLKGRGGPERYRRFFEYPWLPEKPNIGFLVEHEGRVRGFVGGIYARRPIRGDVHTFCNLTSLLVDEDFRASSLPALKRLLERPDWTYTSFSASKTVIEILQFFKFRIVDGSKVLFTPAAGIGKRLHRGARVHRGAGLEAALAPEERAIVRDHAGYRCGLFLLEARGERCFVVTIRRGRDVRAFADVVHASNPRLLAEYVGHLHVPVGLTHRTLLIGLDRRFVPHPPPASVVYSRVRPIAFRSPSLEAGDLDMLYSEMIPMYA